MLAHSVLAPTKKKKISYNLSNYRSLSSSAYKMESKNSEKAKESDGDSAFEQVARAADIPIYAVTLNFLL